MFQIEAALKPCGPRIPENRGCLSNLIVREGNTFLAVKVDASMKVEFGFFLPKNESIDLHQRRKWPSVSKTMAGKAYFVSRISDRNFRNFRLRRQNWNNIRVRDLFDNFPRICVMQGEERSFVVVVTDRFSRRREGGQIKLGCQIWSFDLHHDV